MERRSYGLDLWRAVSVWMVLIGHVSYWFNPSENGFYNTFVTPLNFGVEPFFVLGGFLAALTFKKEITGAKDSFTKTDINIYLKRRWLRTLPNYFLFLLIYSAAFYLVKPDFQFQYSYLLFLQNFNWLAPNFFSVSWSLATQEWFYLLFPILIYTVTTAFRKRSGNFILIAAILLMGVAFLARGIYLTANDVTSLEGELRRIALLRLDSISIGVLIGCFYIKRPAIFNAHKIIIIPIAILLLISLSYLRRYEGFYSSSFVQFFYYPLFSLTIGILIPYFYELRSNVTGLFPKLIVLTSKLSYSIYLCHVLILDIIFTGATKLGIPLLSLPYTFAFVIAWLMIVYVTSTFLYFKFEMPVMKSKLFK